MEEMIEAILNDAHERVTNAKFDYMDQVYIFDELAERFSSLSIQAIRAGHDIEEF